MLVELEVVSVVLDVEVELEFVVPELVVEVEMLVDEVVDGADRLVKTKYALVAAMAITTMTMPAAAIPEIPPLSCGKNLPARPTPFKSVGEVLAS